MQQIAEGESMLTAEDKKRLQEIKSHYEKTIYQNQRCAIYVVERT